MHIKSQQTLWEAIFWLALASGAYAMTAGFSGLEPDYDLSPAFWPRVLLIGMLAAGFILLLSAISWKPSQISPPRASPKTDEPAPPSETQSFRLSWRIVGIFLLPVVYVVAMHKLGFLLVTPIFLPAFMFLLGVRRIRPLVFVSGGIYAVVILIFVKLIYTPLPQGAGYFHSLNGQLIGLLQ